MAEFVRANWEKTKRDNMHVPYGWFGYSMFFYGDPVHPLKMYHGKDYAGKFEEHNEAKANWLYTIFP